MSDLIQEQQLVFTSNEISDIYYIIIGTDLAEICEKIWEYLSISQLLVLRLLNKLSYNTISNSSLIWNLIMKNIKFPMRLVKISNVIIFNNITDCIKEFLPEKYVPSVMKIMKAPELTNKCEKFIQFIKFRIINKISDKSSLKCGLNTFYNNNEILEYFDLFNFNSPIIINDTCKVLHINKYLISFIKDVYIKLENFKIRSIALKNNLVHIEVRRDMCYIYDTIDNIKQICSNEESMMLVDNPNKNRVLIYVNRIGNINKQTSIIIKYVHRKYEDLSYQTICILCNLLFGDINESNITCNSKYEKLFYMTLILVRHFPYWMSAHQIFKFAVRIYNLITKDYDKDRLIDLISNFVCKIEKISNIQYINLINNIYSFAKKMYKQYNSENYESLFELNIFDE